MNKFKIITIYRDSYYNGLSEAIQYLELLKKQTENNENDYLNHERYITIRIEDEVENE